MKNLGSKFSTTILYFSFVIFGFIISRFIYIPHFQVSQNIDIANILSILTTIWLAFFITNVLEKKNSDSRIEKDLIIARVASLYEIAETLQIELGTGKVALTEVASSIKRITTSLQSIYKIVLICNFDIDDDLKLKLKEILSDIRNTLTNTPSVNVEELENPDLPIAIRESVVYYNRERISQIEVKFDNLKNILLELQIHINSK
jgi:hypothetical protein